MTGCFVAIGTNAGMTVSSFLSKSVKGDLFLSHSVDTSVWLPLGFIHSSRCGGGLSPSPLRNEAEKQRERDAAAEPESRRATALLL